MRFAKLNEKIHKIKENPFLFVHVPKTGGSNFQYIANNYKESNILIHSHATAYQWKCAIEDTKRFSWNSINRIAFVRNPWDWMVSWWCWENRNNIEIALNIEAFEQSILNKNKFWVWWNKTHKVWSNRNDNQSQYVCINKKLEINFIARFENYEEDFNRIMKITKMDSHVDIKLHKNENNFNNNRPHYLDYYKSLELRKFLRPKLEKDCLRFGYKML
jgi:hypothetical protein